MRFIKICLIFSIFLYSCSGQKSDSTAQNDQLVRGPVVSFDLSDIKERGYLIAFVDNNSTSYFIHRGKPMGFEYELLKRFCDQIDVELEIKIIPGISESFQKLNSGEGDIIAHFLTINSERKKVVNFTQPIVNTNQVLIQRKPEGWIKMHPNTIDRKVIRNQFDLAGKEVYARHKSSYVSRLHNLSEEIGEPIKIIESDSGTDTEDLIKRVVNGEIDYTVADKDIALVNAAYYPVLDVNTAISFPQQIGWAIRNTSSELELELNDWISESKKSGLLNILYNKYFKVNRSMLSRAQSEFASISGSSISEYDDLLKQAADSIGWDWKLLASLAYQESRFKKDIKSWAGAIGLMQLMPRTGKQFGADNLRDPKQNIMAGAAFIRYLDNQWKDKIEDDEERIKFILASYNAGYGHASDAYRMAKELGYDYKKWDGEVERAMLLKSKPEYYNRPEVKYGYCRGSYVVKYVSEIQARFEKYNQLYVENLAAR